MLSKQEQSIALKLARETLDKVFDNKVEINQDYKQQDIFKEKRGVFVTLHKNKQLRGCIGLIESEISLGEGIQEMTLSAAFNDARFPALDADELPFINIEISVLTIPQRIYNIDKIELGKHGVIIKKGFNSGVFLPQVATETNWSKQQFLSQLCSQKAGLAPKCYEDPDAEIYTFEAQVFAEKE